MWPPGLGQEELESAGDVSNPFLDLFLFPFFPSSFGSTGYRAITWAISGLLYDWGNRSESGRARGTHEAVSGGAFFFSLGCHFCVFVF